MKRKLLVAVPLLCLVVVLAWFFRPKHEYLGEAYVSERSTTPGSRRSLSRSERTSAPTGRTRRGHEGPREFRVLSPALGADMGQSNPTSGYVRVRPQDA